MHPWAIGDLVYVKNLRKNGTVVRLQKNGRVTVAIGSINAVCTVQELEPPSTRRNASVRSPIAAQSQVPRPIGTYQHSLDLHGFTSQRAQEALADFLSTAVMADAHTVDIIHGIGSGTLRRAVHTALASYDFVTRFELLPFNAGTTRVYFD